MKCTDCDYTKEISLETGISFFELDEILDIAIKDKNLVEEIRDILYNHEVLDYTYSNEFVFCKECNQIYTKLIVQIIYDDYNYYITSYKCDECDTKLKLFGVNDISSMFCPVCKNGIIYIGHEDD
jgi:hypothetical protein